jgi:hypothetical protein
MLIFSPNYDHNYKYFVQSCNKRIVHVPRLGGRRFGPPLAQNRELTFDGFDTILLQFRTVFKMTGNLGRVRRTSILMVTGMFFASMS